MKVRFRVNPNNRNQPQPTVLSVDLVATTIHADARKEFDMDNIFIVIGHQRPNQTAMQKGTPQHQGYDSFLPPELPSSEALCDRKDSTAPFPLGSRCLG